MEQNVRIKCDDDDDDVPSLFELFLRFFIQLYHNYSPPPKQEAPPNDQIDPMVIITFIIARLRLPIVTENESIERL